MPAQRATIERLPVEKFQPTTTKRHITTREFAAFFRVEAATVRRSHCLNGHYMGVRPIKLPNNRLLWPEAAVIRVLTGPGA